MTHSPIVHPVIHFVGFKDERYYNAVRVWGSPHYVHIRWDRRAQRDIVEGDIVVFAYGDESQPIKRYNGPDIIEDLLLDDPE